MRSTLRIDNTERLTYSEWEALHQKELLAKREAKRFHRHEFAKQWLVGGALLLTSVISPVLLKDFTISGFTLLLGIGLLTSKDKFVG